MRACCGGREQHDGGREGMEVGMAKGWRVVQEVRVEAQVQTRAATIRWWSDRRRHGVGATGGAIGSWTVAVRVWRGRQLLVRTCEWCELHLCSVSA